MNTFNVKEAAEHSLLLLEQSGASAKTIKNYRNTGFGAIIRHFAQQGSFDVTAEMLDAFALGQREKFDRGEFSEWKWRIVRRGSELLKQYVQTGKIEMPDLRPWNPALQRTSQSVELDSPTPEQLTDVDNLFALIWRVKQELHTKGLTKSTIRHYTAEGLTVILRRHITCGLEVYSELLTSEMVAEKRDQYERGQTSRVSYQNLRKASFLLSEMHQTGKITLSKLPDWGQREPTTKFAETLRHFCDEANRTGLDKPLLHSLQELTKCKFVGYGLSRKAFAGT